MNVIKISPYCFSEANTCARILDLLTQRGPGHIVVVSALTGVTDTLLNSLPQILEQEEAIAPVIQQLRETHLNLARHLMGKTEAFEEFAADFETGLCRLERLYYGLHAGQEMTPKAGENISSFGDRFVVELLVDALQARKIRARALMPEKIGLVAEGKPGEVAANMLQTTRNFKKQVAPLVEDGRILVVAGSFGVSENGDILSFGRDGGDYSAAVIAGAILADGLEIWTDRAGFLSADPTLIPDAHVIPLLSYEEAAELACFTPSIIHPQIFEPVGQKRVKIAVKNIHAPDAPGTEIAFEQTTSEFPINAIVQQAQIGVLKAYAPGGGFRPGILGRLAGQLAKNGVNLFSVVTSLSCLTMIVAGQDAEAGYQALKGVHPHPYQRLERLDDVTLIAIIGAGLSTQPGLAARCFSMIAKCGVAVEMLSFSPSRVALYVVVRNQDVQTVVNTLHKQLFTPII